jgi:hypothetical protein
MILFYRDYFFPAGHVDEGKPVPLGLMGQLGLRPHSLTPEWLEYKKLMFELEIKGYSSITRNGDDPIQERLRSEHYTVTDPHSFEELYRIGLAKIGGSSHDSSLVPRVAGYLTKTAELLAAYNQFQQEYRQMHTAQTAIAKAGSLFHIVAEAKKVMHSPR